MSPSNPKIPQLPFKLSGESFALLLGGILIGALVIGFGFKMATPIVKKACQSILESSDKVAREPRVVSIEAVAVKPGTISRRITTVGKLRANESVTLRAEMPGRLKEIAFKEGTMVKKGDVLIRFDDEELQAELEKAEADVEYRQVRFGRFETLQNKGLGRGTEYDQERGLLNMAKAQVEVAKAKLAKATIYAPFDGKIGLIQDVSVGAIVDGQKELVTLVDFDPMKIDFKVPEKFIHDIGGGQTAEIKLDSIPGENFQATVEAIDSRVDPQTHSIAVRATIPNEDGRLQAGLFASVSVIIGVKNDALLVPESALGREGDIEYVWVITNGKAGRKRVLTGTKENGQVEIIAGLKPSEIVVTSGQLKLGEGTAVKISNMEGDDVEVLEEDEDAEPTNVTQKEESRKKGEAIPAATPTPSVETEQQKETSNAANVASAPEEEASSLPSPSQNGPSNKEEEAKVASLEKPSTEDKVDNRTSKTTEKLDNDTSQESPETGLKKSFVAKVWGKTAKAWGKVHDFVARKFKEIKETS